MVKSPKAPKAPPPAPVREEDPDIAAEADRQLKIAQARRGRTSTIRTILSQDTSSGGKKSTLGS